MPNTLFNSGCKIAVFLIGFLTISSAAFAEQRQCVLNGNRIDLDDGASTRGVTGIVRCTNEHGIVDRESEYRNGVHVGHEMMIDDIGGKLIRTVNAKGNSDGIDRTYNSKGILTREVAKVDGELDGAQHMYTDAGRLSEVVWYAGRQPVLEINYNPDGTISELKCGKQSYMQEDKEVCGFAGHASKVDLVDSSGHVKSTVVYLNGNASTTTEFDGQGKVAAHEDNTGAGLQRTEYFPNGQIKISAGYSGRVLNGNEKEYSDTGKLIRETLWDMGDIRKETSYYLNGQMKSRAERVQIGNIWEVARQEFWDNGRVSDEGVFLEKTDSLYWEEFTLARWDYDAPVGEHRHYYENGNLAVSENFSDKGDLTGERKGYFESGQQQFDETYDEAGRIRSRKEWDKTGKLIGNEQYLEDGSRVSRSAQ